MNLKNFKIYIFLFFLSSQIFAQSDYRVTQEFKSRQRSFEIAIEYAKTIDELNKIEKEIVTFRNEFKGSKELLNRALYPSNFESSFSTLSKKIEFTQKKITEISGLQTKVTKLESDYSKISKELIKLTNDVNTLKNSNTKLMSQLKAFQSGYGGSKESIDSLKGLISELKDGISKRDTLIKEIMDNIFMTAKHKIESLNDAEKKGIRTKIQGTSLIDNIQYLISDNIEFLEASLFTAEDLTLLNSELKDFETRWSNFGPKLFEIYSTDKKNQDKLNEIDTLIVNWDKSLDKSIWKSINNVFKNHSIDLGEIVNTNEFLAKASDYIDNEIQNNEDKQGIERDQNYVYFADRSWNDVIRPDWVPLLYATESISEEQVSMIDSKLNVWQDSLSGSKSYLIYGLIVLLAIFIIVSIILVKKKNATKRVEAVGITEESEDRDNLDEIDENEQFIDDKKKD